MPRSQGPSPSSSGWPRPGGVEPGGAAGPPEAWSLIQQVGSGARESASVPKDHTLRNTSPGFGAAANHPGRHWLEATNMCLRLCCKFISGGLGTPSRSAGDVALPRRRPATRGSPCCRLGEPGSKLELVVSSRASPTPRAAPRGREVGSGGAAGQQGGEGAPGTCVRAQDEPGHPGAATASPGLAPGHILTAPRERLRP